jgi:thiol-disulfide isomerase/thioredoxin
MRKPYRFFGIAFFSAALSIASAQEKIHWHPGKWQKMLAYADSVGKPVLVDFTAEWCKPCMLMKERELSQPQVAAYVNDHFVPYMLDFDNNLAVARTYNVSVLPSFLVVMPQNGAEVGRFKSYRQANDFLYLVDSLFWRSPYGQTLQILEERWKKPTHDLQLAADYLLMLGHFGYPRQQSEVLAQMCQTFPDELLRQPAAAQLVADYCTSVEGSAFEYLVARQAELPICAFRAQSLLESTFRLAVLNRSDSLLQTVLAASDKFHAAPASSKAAIERHNYAARFLLETKQVLDYVQLMEAWAPKHLLPGIEAGDTHCLDFADQIAVQYLRHVEEPSALAIALNWLQQALKTDRSPARLAYAGRLARKAGQKNQGDHLLQEAVALGKSQGIPTRDWEKLLAER